MKDTFWFKHDYNSRNDDKILELRAEFGAEGYGAYWMLLESMAESSEGTLNKGAIGGLSLGYGMAKDRLLAIIDFCIKTGLFQVKEQAGKQAGNFDLFFSQRMSEHKAERALFRQKGKEGAEKRWNNQSEKQPENSPPISPPNAEQSRADKKRGDKKNNISNEILYAFSDFWKKYSDKRGSKKKAEEMWKKITDPEKEVIMKGLENYLATISDEQFKPYASTFLNQKRWENESYGKKYINGSHTTVQKQVHVQRPYTGPTDKNGIPI